MSRFEKSNDLHLKKIDGLLTSFDFLKTPSSYFTNLNLPQGLFMQSFAITQDGANIFVSYATGTGNGSPEDFTIYRMTSTGKILDSMTVTNGGHCDFFGIEEAEDGIYIWSNIGYASTGNTLGRIKYVGGITYTTTDSAVVTYSNFGSGEYVYPTIIDGTYTLFLRRTSNSWKVEKRKLADVKIGTNMILNTVAIPTDHIWIQGITGDGDNLYILTGDANGATYPMKLSLFSFSTGNLISERLIDFGAGTNGSNEGSYKEPEGVYLFKDSNGYTSLLIGISTGTNSLRYNKVYGLFSTVHFQMLIGDKTQDIPINSNEPWQIFTLLNSSTSQWGETPIFRKEGDDIIRWAGWVKPNATGSVVFQVPKGYYPKYEARFDVAGDGAFVSSRVSIDPATGNVTVDLGTGITDVCLDGISYAIL